MIPSSKLTGRTEIKLPNVCCLSADYNGVMARAIVMPNLKPPVTTTADALAYRLDRTNVADVEAHLHVLKSMARRLG